GLIAGLVPMSAIAALAPRMAALNVEEGVSVKYPVAPSTPTVLPFVGEAQPIPVQARTLTSIELAANFKVGAHMVLSRELVRNTVALPVVKQIAQRDVGYSVDLALLSSTAASAGVRPAGLLNGVTPTEGGYETPQSVLAALAMAVGTGGSGEVAFIASPGR